ncbi:MAG: TIM-barrel domain-containing protein, partial [Bacillota bacterium]
YQGPSPIMSINVPLLLSTRGYALFMDNTYLGSWDIGAGRSDQYFYHAYGGEINYYLIVSPDIKGQLEKYTWLTGRQPLPPKWTFGYIQSRYGYKNEAETRAVVETMRQKQIPCDAVILDLYWFSAKGDPMGNLQWYAPSWPDPFKMMRDFLAKGIKTVVITEPYLTYNTQNYYEALANGYLTKDANGNAFTIPDWWSCNCAASLLDITNPAAQKWWWGKHPNFFGNELAGIWTDLGEPESHPFETNHYLGPMKKVHNIYNLLWAKTLFEGYREFRPNQRLFNLTRAGFAGMQRYGAITWSGDVAQSFNAMAYQLPNLLNTGLSGLGYHHSDAGGFVSLNNSPELYTRWLQFGAFSPVMRAHGNSPREPWAFGPDAESITKQIIELRYKLLPYIYTTAHENYETGAPIIRPLVFEYQNDPNVSNMSDPYLFGSNLLVSPVYQMGQTQKSVYLPQGQWIDFWTDKLYTGGQTYSVAASLDKLPLFIKAGSVIPIQEVMNYSNEKILDTLTLSFYPSNSSNENQFTLYEDDGFSLEYQSGSFSNTFFSQRATEQSDNGKSLVLDIVPDLKKYNNKPLTRTYISDVHLVSKKPSSVVINNHQVNEKTSLKDLKNSSNGFYFDQNSSRLFVLSGGSIDSTYHIEVNGIDFISNVRMLSSSVLKEYTLEQNYPNPFNPTTRLRFSLPQKCVVELSVYDLLGKEVASIINNEEKAAGKYEISFDGGLLPSGIYFYKLKAGDFITVRKMNLVK